jgi:SnoaL-like domain
VDTTEKLWAREQIRDRLHVYCNGIDRRDWALVRSCFADDHVHSHGGFTGSADAFVDFASAVLAFIPATHHSISNVQIDFAADGLSAVSQANFVAYHRIEAGHYEGTPVPTGGKATDWTVAGRYCDRLEKRDGHWLIVKRDAVHDWERAGAARE